MPALFAWFFLSFKGRISREQFWLGYGLTVVVMLLFIPRAQDVLLALARPGGPWSRSELNTTLLIGAVIASLIMTFPLFALYVKRLHDCDLSGWWLAGFFVVMVVLEIAGLAPKNVSMVLAAAIGAVPGKRGDNRFGPDPIVTKT